MEQREKTEYKVTDFDSDLSPYHEHNQQAAKERRLSYDKQRESYVDEDGCLRRDSFGQPY